MRYSSCSISPRDIGEKVLIFPKGTDEGLGRAGGKRGYKPILFLNFFFPSQEREAMSVTQTHLDSYGSIGLRTLLVGAREV